MTPVSPEVLPKDVLFEILLRSPVKSLLRFKAVCKEWQSIITSPCFQYKHFSRESNRVDLLVCWSGYTTEECDIGVYNYPSFDYVDSISLFANGVLETNPIEQRGGLSECVCNVCGPCNGIICVSYSNCTYALWNPATRKSWPIPDHPSVHHFEIFSFSFWINPLTNEFKVFWITPEYDQVKILRRPFNFITYSSSNDSWSHIDLPVYHGEQVHLFNCRYSVTNGFFYFCKWNWTTKVYTLMEYDISNELFQEIHMPEVEIGSSLQVNMDLYGESLALFISEFFTSEQAITVETRRTEIWVMKERGCWIKLFTVSIPNLFNSDTLGFWKGNEFFISRYPDEFAMNNELMIYDPLSGKTRKVEVEKVDGAQESATYPLCYKESLISVRGYEA